MARWFPLARRLFSSRPACFSVSSNPKPKKRLLLPASDVAVACDFHPFILPSEIVTKHWKRTDPEQYEKAVLWAATSIESRDEMASRLAESTSASQQITQLALETAREAETTPGIQEATRTMVEKLESVDEPSQEDKQKMIHSFARGLEEMAVEVNERLESAQMAPEEKASAKVAVEQTVQTAMDGVVAKVGALSSASPEPKADLQQKLQEALEYEQQHLTSFVDQLSSSPEEEKKEISSLLSSRFAEAKQDLQLQVVALRPALSSEDKQLIAQHFQSTMNKEFGARHEQEALDSFEKSAQMRVANRNSEYHQRVLGETKQRWVVLGGKVDGILENGTVVEVKNRVNGFKDPLPLYDIVQLQTYLFITKSSNGELVEQYKYNDSLTKSTPVPWDRTAWYEVVRPRLARFCNAFDKLLEDDVAQVRFLRAKDEEKKEIFGEFLEEAPEEFAASRFSYSKHKKVIV